MSEWSSTGGGVVGKVGGVVEGGVSAGSLRTFVKVPRDPTTWYISFSELPEEPLQDQGLQHPQSQEPKEKAFLLLRWASLMVPQSA